MTAQRNVLAADTEAKRVLQQGSNAWRIERAHRAAVLVDAAAYFGALRAAMRRAKHRILIIGWDIDSRTPLVGPEGAPQDEMPAALGEFLGALVQDQPRLSVKLLLWNYSLLYALEREPLPLLTLQWNTPRQIELCLDDDIPVGSAHHQKIVVIDDTLAFVGGLDLTIRRWDTSDHQPGDPRRVDPAGTPYLPFHDVQMTAATAIADLARWRWARATREDLQPGDVAETPWPESVAPQFQDVAVGISRTLPSSLAEAEVREVEALFEDMIDAARHSIYIENQFLTCTRIAARLAARMQAMPALEAVILGPHIHHNWVEHTAMRSGRARFMETLRAAGVGDRVRLLYPRSGKGGDAADVMLHSKLMIVDDRLLRIGSANLCNRSMGVDSECDLTIEAADASDRATIRVLRARLLAEHCGVERAEMERLIGHHGSLHAAIDDVPDGPRRLAPIDDGPATGAEAGWGISAVADPRYPMELHGFIGRVLGSVRSRWRGLLRLTPLVAAALLLLLAWRATSLADWAKPETLRTALHGISDQGWGPLLVIGLFVIGGLVMFPVTVMIAATAAAFGAWPGIIYAGAGALGSALVTYGIGRWLGERPLHDVMGPRLHRIRDGVARRGLLAMTTIRLVPIAPFTLVNLVAGAARIRLFDFAIGTILGLAPGLITLSALGERLISIFHSPTLADIGMLLAVVIAWIALSVGLQTLVSRRRRDPS